MESALLHQASDLPSCAVRRWIERPALRTLVELFGGSWPDDADLRTQLQRLVDFSAVWDWRNGGMRLDMAQMDEEDTRAPMIGPLVAELGLVRPTRPVGGAYDWLLVLGGLAATCRSRVAAAGALIADGSVAAAEVCLLGSLRTLRPEEAAEASRYAPGARAEVDLLQAMAELTWPSGQPWEMKIDGDRDRAPHDTRIHGVRPGRPLIRLYAARSSDPRNRPANTADTYRAFAEDVHIRKGQRLLLVTTPAYTVFQYFDALRALALPFDVDIETVGGQSASGTAVPTLAGYLQEVRSALLSALRLVDAAEPAAGR